MTTTPERPDYTPAERLNVGHEDIAESGFALVSHIDDPSFVVAVRPRKTPVEDAVVSTYKPGDRCRLLGGYRVEHHDCDQYRDGVVTDVRTGRIVGDR